jgi:hypothetical protein
MSTKYTIPLTCGVFLWLLVAPLTAMAADFTFNIPVTIQNQNAAINNGEVRCTVYLERRILKQTPMGEGVQFFSLDSLGNFQGTLTVAIFVSDDPADVQSYDCVLRLQDNNGDFIQHHSIGGNNAVDGDIVQTAPGH